MPSLAGWSRHYARFKKLPFPSRGGAGLQSCGKAAKKPASAAAVPGPVGSLGLPSCRDTPPESWPESALPILPDVIFELLVFERVSDPPVQEAWLPWISFYFQVLIELKRESSLDQLHGPFQCDSRGGNDQVKMVRHDNKFM